MSLFTSEITVDNLPLPVDGSAVTQPVSAVALPLPTGAATNAAVLALTKPSDVQLVDGSAHTQPVSGSVSISGSVSVSNFPATQPVSIAAPVAVTGPLTDTQLRATPVPVSSTPATSNSATVAQVVLTMNVNATLLAANANRKKVILFAPKSTLYVKFGATASATSFTYALTSANSTLEITTWTGQIDVLTTAGQTVNVTELV